MEYLSWASALGLFIGMRHAMEPDHIAAVSTIVSSEKSFHGTARIGLAWGIGHTLALTAAGGLLLALRLEFPGPLASAIELCVGLVLIAMGVTNLRRALREGRHGPFHLHFHGPGAHAHASPMQHVHLGRFVLAGRPFCLGLLHGLAGTGALAAMVLASMPTIGSALAYITVFGVGSMIGMMLVTNLLGATIRRWMWRDDRRAVFQGGTGALSLVVGLVWSWISLVQLVGR